MLDADNVAVPHGVHALYEAARATAATFTYGNVLLFDQRGSQFVLSNEPIVPAFTHANYIDTLAVIDVDRIAALGSYTLAPLLYALDDYELIHRLVDTDELLAFVPTVVGRYRLVDGSHSHAIRDARPGYQHLARAHRAGSESLTSRAHVVVTHPSCGRIWTSPAATTTRQPSLAPNPDQGTRPRILVVASGGVANLGDEAMTLATIQRLARLRTAWQIDVIADSDEIATEGLESQFVGTLHRVCAGISDDEIEAGCSDQTLRNQFAPSRPSRQPSLLDPRDYQLALFAGGGNLNHIWFETLTCWRAILVAGLRAYGLPVVFSGQGIGPIEDDREQAVIAYLVDASSSFGLREPTSLDVMRKLGFRLGPVEVVGDDALGLAPPPDETVDRALAAISVAPDSRYLVAHARRADYLGTDDARLRAWTDAVDRLAAERCVAVIGLAINHQSPHSESETLASLASAATRQAEWHVLDCGTSPGLAAAVASRAGAAVVHSYHAALFALQAKVPALLIAGTPYSEMKATGLARYAGLPDDFVVRPVEGFANLGQRLDTVAAALKANGNLADAAPRIDAWLDRALKAAVDQPTAV